MKQNDLKLLVKGILKEYNLQAPDGDSKISDYLFKEVVPIIEHLTKNIFYCDASNGSFSWEVNGVYNGKTFDVVHASPFWSSRDKIDIVVSFVDEGEETVKTIDYPEWNWTGNPNNDASLYIKTILPILLELRKKNISEMSSTGGVGGYSTPFAFTKNKKGSPKGIAAAKKYGTVVGESPRV